MGLRLAGAHVLKSTVRVVNVVLAIMEGYCAMMALSIALSFNVLVWSHALSPDNWFAHACAKSGSVM